MIFNRRRFSLLLVFAVFFSLLSPLGTQLASAYTYRDPSANTEELCSAKGGVLVSAYNGSSLETYCEIRSSASDDSRIVLYAGWLADCVQGEIRSDPNFELYQLEETRLDYGDDQIIGHWLDPANGQIKCNEPGNIKSALSTLGYSSLIALLRDIGCTESGSTFSCVDDKVTSLSAHDLYNKFVSNKYANVGLSNYTKYFLALNTFITGCKATEKQNPTEVDYFALNNDSGTHLYKLQVLNNDGTGLRDAIYETELARDRNISTINESVGWDDGSFHCETLASMVNDLASSYLIYAKADPALAERDTNNTVGTPETPEEADATTTCAVEGVGWIVCPVLNFISNITDAIYSLISSWLEVDVTLIDTNSGTFRGWMTMRDLANTGFVIIFLIVIFSQLTGTGISNYGVKKTLPRLVIMAVAINASFYITQLCVDISNILGSSVASFFSSQAVFGNSATGFLANGNTFSDVGMTLLAGGTVAGVAAAASVGAITYGGVGLFIMVILAAIVAVATTLLILALRQALIVILIVVSPLAFLALVLPNTKKWFDNWRKIFISLLVIYPMIGIVFGASEMAANILVQENQILGLAVATVPLFAVIPMLKGSLNAVPIVGNMASKLAGRASLGGSVKSRAKQARGNFANDMRSRALGGEGGGRVRQATRWLAGGRARGAARDRRYGTDVGMAEAVYGANRALAEGSDATPREKAAAVSALRKIEEEEISAAQTQQQSMQFNAIKDMATTGTYQKDGKTITVSEVERTAAIRHIMDNGNFNDRKALVEGSHSMSERQRESVSRGVMAKGDHKVYGASIGDTILSGGANEDTLKKSTAETIKAGKIDANTVARDAASAQYIADVAIENKHGIVDGDHKRQLAEAADEANSNTELKKGISAEHAKHIDTLRRL